MISYARSTFPIAKDSLTQCLDKPNLDPGISYEKMTRVPGDHLMTVFIGDVVEKCYRFACLQFQFLTNKTRVMDSAIVHRDENENDLLC